MPAGQSMWLLLHGTPLTPAIWEGVLPSLKALRAVKAPLLRTPSTATGAQGELAEAVLSDLPAADGPFHLVGHSFGGQVALEVTFRVPDRVRSLTILCSRASPFAPFADAAAALRRGDPVDIEAGIGRWFRPTEVAADGPVVRYARQCLLEVDRSTWADELDAIATYDRRGDLATIEVPTSIIAAELDQVGTPAEMSSMASCIPGATFETIANAAHMSPFLDGHSLARRLIAAADRMERPFAAPGDRHGNSSQGDGTETDTGAR